VHSSVEGPTAVRDSVLMTMGKSYVPSLTA
jgi:hypothetical protein